MVDVRATAMKELVAAEDGAPVGADTHIEAHKAVKEREDGSRNSACSVMEHTATRSGGVGATGPARQEGQHSEELRPVRSRGSQNRKRSAWSSDTKYGWE